MHETDLTLSTPCPDCSSTEGLLRVGGGYSTLFCAACGTELAREEIDR